MQNMAKILFFLFFVSFFQTGCDDSGGSKADPCLNVSCSGNGYCLVQYDVAVCSCFYGYHPEGLNCVRDPQPCDDITCSGHGTCVDDGEGNVFCDCDEGYLAQDLECILDVQPCDGITCSGHGTCVDDGEGNVSCDCDEGYLAQGLECIAEQSPCLGVLCSGHGTCLVDGEDNPYCDCDNGFVAQDLECVSESNPCSGVNCSFHGVCLIDGNGDAICDCDNGYIADGLNCLLDNDPPVIISMPGTDAVVGVQYIYEVECMDPDGDGVSLSVDPTPDTCNGSLADHGDGTGTYTFTPSSGMVNTTCNVSIRCSDGNLFDLQTEPVHVSGNVPTTLQTVQFGGYSDDIANDVSSGRQYWLSKFIVGETSGSLNSLASLGNKDAFFAFYSEFYDVWEYVQWGSTAFDSAQAVATYLGDPASLADAMFSNVVVGTTEGNFDGNTSAGGRDCFLTYFLNEEKLQTLQWGTSNNDVASDVVYDNTTTAVYVSGYTCGAMNGQVKSGMCDLFVAKYNGTTHVWTRQIGTGNTSTYATGTGIAIDSLGNVVVVGTTSGTFDGNLSAGGEDIILVKYNSAGTKQWSRQVGSAGNDTAMKVAISNTDIYLTGYTTGSLDGTTTNTARDAFLLKFNSAGTQQWTRQLGSTLTSAEDYGFGVSVDTSVANGNIAISGVACGSLTGNTSVGGCDAFVAVYNPSGVLQQAKQWGSPTQEVANAVYYYNNELLFAGYSYAELGSGSYGYSQDFYLASWATGPATPSLILQNGGKSDESAFTGTMDTAGNFYVAGWTLGNLTRKSVDQWDKVYPVGKYDSFLAKFNSAGIHQWTTQWGSTESDLTRRVQVDASGNIYVVGLSYGSMNGLTAVGLADIYVKKFNSAGVEQWTRLIGTTADDYAYDLAVDAAGNLYLTGATGGNLNGNTSAGNMDVYVIKYNTSGTIQWTRQFGTAQYDIANGIVLASTGDIYATGVTCGAMSGQVQSGGCDLFITKINSSGIIQWNRQIGTGNASTLAVGTSIVVDSANDIVISGYSDGQFDSNSSSGSNDIILVKLDAAGNKLFSRQFGGTNDDYALRLDLDSTDFIYLTGSTQSSLDGNPLAGEGDIFLMKVSPLGVRQWTELWGTDKDDSGNDIILNNAGAIHIFGSTKGLLAAGDNTGASDAFILFVENP